MDDIYLELRDERDFVLDGEYLTYLKHRNEDQNVYANISFIEGDV